MVAVYGIQRELGDQLQGLLQNIVDGDVLRVLIIGVHGQHTLLQGVHHIGAGSFHDNVPHEGFGKLPVDTNQIDKLPQLLSRGQFAKQQKVGGLLEGKPTVGFAADQILHIDALKIQFAVDGNPLSVDVTERNHVRNLSQSGQDALTAGITQTSFYIIIRIQPNIDLTGTAAVFYQFVKFLIYQHIVFLHIISSSLSAT